MGTCYLPLPDDDGDNRGMRIGGGIVLGLHGNARRGVRCATSLLRARTMSPISTSTDGMT